MRINIDKEAVDYIRKKGGVVNIDLYTSKSCCAEVTEPVTNFLVPKSLEQFEEHCIEDVKIYVSKFIHMKDEALTVKLKSLMGIKTLSLSGIRML